MSQMQVADGQPAFEATLPRITSGKLADVTGAVPHANGSARDSLPAGPDPATAQETQNGQATALPNPRMSDIPHGLPAAIRDAMRRVSNRRTLSIESNVHKDFACGDSYDGSWQAGLPQARGTYTWADGSRYEGEWQVPLRARDNPPPPPPGYLSTLLPPPR